MAHHAADIVLFDVPPPIQSRGLAESQKSWDQFFRWFGDSGVFELSELEIAAGDDVGFCHRLIHCAGSEPAGETAQLVVRLTVCYRKIDGQWRVMHEHHSEPSADA
jgi:ketosteroid isomerase-like protein